MLKYLVSAAFLVAAAPSIATAPQSSLRSVTVHYSDLDLGRAEGRQRLERRVDAAVRTVCGDPGVQGLASSAEVSRCMSIARAAANRSMATAIASATAPGRSGLQFASH